MEEAITRLTQEIKLLMVNTGTCQEQGTFKKSVFLVSLLVSARNIGAIREA